MQLRSDLKALIRNLRDSSHYVPRVVIQALVTLNPDDAIAALAMRSVLEEGTTWRAL
jgi:hypothetical protein